MLQHSQKNNSALIDTKFYTTQFGVFKVIMHSGSIVAAEFVDFADPNESIKTVELSINSFKEYPLKPIGTSFQQKVWQALLQIPYGKTMSYLDVASSINKQTAVRAVASAIARNPIAFLIPCHRVIRKNGEYGQYRWGADTKKRLLEWERNNQ